MPLEQSGDYLVSSFCSSGACVGVKFDEGAGRFLVVDTKLPAAERSRSALRLSATEWEAFVEQVGGDIEESPVVRLRQIGGSEGPTEVLFGDGNMLAFSTEEWAAFKLGIRNGDFQEIG